MYYEYLVKAVTEVNFWLAFVALYIGVAIGVDKYFLRAKGAKDKFKTLGDVLGFVSLLLTLLCVIFWVALPVFNVLFKTSLSIGVGAD